MENYEQRIVNGVLKSDLASDPDGALGLLSRNIEVTVSPDRATEGDLWPAIWALCNALERQFTGRIYVNAGLERPLTQPARLSSRCIFGKAEENSPIKISIGCNTPREHGGTIVGDARGARISYGSRLPDGERATPTSCFALAGYLGFAALAHAVGVPPFRKDLAIGHLTLPMPEIVPRFGDVGLTFWGLGHLGNAYLSLLFFQRNEVGFQGSVVLLDGGYLEDGNWHTHALVEKDSDWLGKSKADYLSKRVETWGISPIRDQLTIDWGWTRPPSHPHIVLLGFDNFPARRMAAAAGYSWLVESGLGDSFVEPKLTWHSIPGHAGLGKLLFPDREEAPKSPSTGTFASTLKSKPGCGHFDYEQVHASAPSMGLVASAFVWAELLRVVGRSSEAVQGTATLWSPMLPYFREHIDPNIAPTL